MLDKNKFLKHNRLRSQADFKAVFDVRARIRSPYYLLYYRVKDESAPRLGLVAAKRNIRTAVARNRLKRIARETFRTSKAKIEGVDIVFVIQRQAMNATNQEVHQCLDKLFKQLIARLEKR